MAHQMNQMMQMMQMQMQSMQQASQTMGGQLNQMPNMPQFAVSQNPATSRPQSMQIPNPSAPQPGQRTMSTINPPLTPWGFGQQPLPSININGSYPPSIAPSERSNIGLASRYRPVSTAPEPDVISHHRASTFTSTSVRPWDSTDRAPRASNHASKPSATTLGRRSPLTYQDDEDDEQGWAEMKMKKEKKQKNWALRKGQNALQELYNPAS